MKDEQNESVWAGMKERKLERTGRKWHREYLRSPDMCKWLTWEEYNDMRGKFNKKIFTWEDVMKYKETLNKCGYDESLECPVKTKSSIYHDRCKKVCKYFILRKCPKCNEILGEGNRCILCGWVECEQEDEKSRAIPKDVQREVWRRDLGKCVECGSKQRLEYDHIIPFSKGGSNTARNIQLLCEKCNRSKGNNI